MNVYIVTSYHQIGSGFRNEMTVYSTLDKAKKKLAKLVKEEMESLLLERDTGEKKRGKTNWGYTKDGLSWSYYQDSYRAQYSIEFDIITKEVN